MEIKPGRTVADHPATQQFDLTRVRQVTASRKTATLSPGLLYPTEAVLGPALPKGSVGQGAVLLALLQGLLERPWFGAPFLFRDADCANLGLLRDSSQG